MVGARAGAAAPSGRATAALHAAAPAWDEAERRCDAALAANTALSSPPWVAHTQADYADLLTRRDRPGDRAAAPTAARHGMRALAARRDGAA